MKILRIEKALKGLKEINEEIRYKSCVEADGFSTGLIAFRPKKKKDAKQIRHPDKDVICHVLRGRGRLRVEGRRVALRPGIVCHIPKGTPHDFAAGKTELVLLYLLIINRGQDVAPR